MTSLGPVYSITYPKSYTRLLNSLSVVNLSFFSVFPLSCTIDGLNFYSELLVYTVILPGTFLEPSWNLPRTFLELSWNLPGIPGGWVT